MSDKKPVLISVIVPVYNSSGILEELCTRLVSVLQGIAGDDYEIILADDCSSDGVWEKIKLLAQTNFRMKGFRLGKNFGQWMATLAGIEQSSGKYIVTIDDDLEYDPADIARLYRTITTNDYYLVFGIAPQKYNYKNRNPLTAAFRNRVINLLWQKFITDSYKIFERSLLFKNEKFSPKVHFEAFVKHTLHERFVGYEEVSYHQRFEGSSNHTIWKKIRIFLHFSIEYYRAPVTAMAMIAAVFFTASILLEYFLFRGQLNGLLNTVIGLTILSLSFILLQYVVHIFRSLKNIPDYWIVERTG